MSAVMTTRGVSYERLELACPKCGCDHLHPTKVSVWMRPEDDMSPGIAVIAGGYSKPAPADGNPSERREGIVVEFWGESCGEEGCRQRLIVEQHKGPTFLYWEQRLPSRN